jgi:hypothetical protein
MRAIQGSYPRLKDKLLFSESIENRKVFLNLITMLLQYQPNGGDGCLIFFFNPTQGGLWVVLSFWLSLLSLASLTLADRCGASRL